MTDTRTPARGVPGVGVDLLRSERSMIAVRWVATAFGLVQILAYEDAPYPEEIPVFALGLAAMAVLAAGNGALWIASRREVGARALALAGLALDVLVAEAIVWLWAFDPGSALWAILYVLPLEGAIKFQLRGALGTWAAVTALYVAREFWGYATFEGFNLQWNSITFRMGLGLLIALVGGLMARNLTRERALAEDRLTRLRRIDRLRAGLVSTLAHDVRNPIAAIRGTITILLSPRVGRLSKETRLDLLRSADRQAERLERLAIDLLDLARLERGRLELTFENVSMAPLVRRALAYVEGAHRIEVEVPDDVVLRADPGRVEQILVNLVSNALRYGREPFELRVSSPVHEVVVQVTDRGEGIPPDQQPTLFDPFRSEREGGSVGFGLAIVKALAEAHGGSAAYRDRDGGGACFVVRLPVAGPV
ncbi:MAG TPA: ATP-binding protein [Actinomycetota bacterium]